MIDTTYTSNDLEGTGGPVFELKIGFNFIEYAIKYIPDYWFQLMTTGLDWQSNVTYNASSIVIYEGMLYQANVNVEEEDIFSPNLWFDDNNDNINDNIWKPLYPWTDGDFVIIEPYGWYQDGDSWIANLAEIGKLDENSADDLNEIQVVPNPYIVNSNYFNESPGNNLIRFTRLPTKCTISIYTISGEKVRELSHDSPVDGNAWWDLRSYNNQEVAPGLYIYVVEAPGAEPKIDKFAIVR